MDKSKTVTSVTFENAQKVSDALKSEALKHSDNKEIQLALFSDFEIKESRSKWLKSEGTPKNIIINKIEDYLNAIQTGEITGISIKINKKGLWIVRAGLPKE